MTKKILYLDMDGVMVDFEGGIDKLTDAEKIEWEGDYDKHPEIFSLMPPMPGALDAYDKLVNCGKYDVYFLSTVPWGNPIAAMHKIEWVKKYIPTAFKNIIMSHHKNLNKGDILIDDRLRNGVEGFEGKHIHFGTEMYPNWDVVLEELL